MNTENLVAGEPAAAFEDDLDAFKTPAKTVAANCDGTSPSVVEVLKQVVHEKPAQHEITITADPGFKELCMISVRSLYSGDVFEKQIMPKDLPGLTDPPQIFSLNQLDQLFKLMKAGIEAEADGDNSGPVQCVSCEEQHADPNDKLYVLRFTVQQFLASFQTVLTLRLKSAAALETRFDIKLGALEETLRNEIIALEQRVNLMQLQMNRRVFFGVNHSVHVKCTKLAMVKTPLQGRNIDVSTVARNGSAGIHKTTSVPTVEGLESALFATDTEVIMSLPSSELTPLQLCRELIALSVFGAEITDLDFLMGLPKLAEVTVDNAQIRDLAPLATLPRLRKLTVTNLNLMGGGEIDLSPLEQSATLAEMCFKGSSSVANIAPLAKIPTLRLLDVTECARVTDRRAFTSNPNLKVVPE